MIEETEDEAYAVRQGLLWLAQNPNYTDGTRDAAYQAVRVLEAAQALTAGGRTEQPMNPKGDD